MNAIDIVAAEHGVGVATVEAAVELMWQTDEEITYDMAEEALYEYYEAHEHEFIEEAEESLY